MRYTLLVAITVAIAACGRPSPGVRTGEDDPAAPCSVNGMLFRDTPRCVLATDPPDPTDAGWIDVSGDRKHEFHPGTCLEWFDAAAWNDEPWTPRFDPSTQLACDSAAAR